MYAIDLICSNGHQFEAMFRNRTAFEHQRNDGLISCAVCGDSNIKQVISAARIKKHAEKTPSRPTKKPNVAAKVMEFVEKHFEDVGHRFTEEAIKIHNGEVDKRNIRGTATPEDEKTLNDEGVSFLKFPNLQ